jgi:hypothetical protein
MAVLDDGATAAATTQTHTSDDAALSWPVLDLVAAVDALAAQPAADLPGEQAMAEATVLVKELERLRGVVLTRIADVDRRTLHTLADAPSTGTWVAAQQTSLTRAEVALARRLAAFPVVAAAVDDGTMSVAVAARVAAALVKARPHVDRPDGLIDGQPAEPTIQAVVVDGVLSLVCQARGGLDAGDPLVRRLHTELAAIADRRASELDRLTAAFGVLASHVEPGDLPGALGQLLDALLPNELERRAEDAHEQRGFRMRLKEDGSGWLVTRGDLDLECGELLNAVLTAELATDEDSPLDTQAYAQARQDGWQTGDELPPAGCGGPRSLDQRRHDALRNGLRRSLDSGITGLRDKVAPHLSVTVSLGALHDSPGALPPVAASGARLPRSLVHAWWCDSAVTRFVLGLGHKVIEMSHTERTLKLHERRAKRIETGGRCQGAGCRRGPGHRLVPHHADPWARTGTTSLDDTVLFCEQTHHALTAGARSCSRTADGSGRTAGSGTQPHDPTACRVRAVRRPARAPARPARPGP